MPVPMGTPAADWWWLLGSELTMGTGRQGKGLGLRQGGQWKGAARALVSLKAGRGNRGRGNRKVVIWGRWPRELRSLGDEEGAGQCT
jgi:hypothetical protein